MSNYIRKMSGKQYAERIAKNPTVIIPTGACEIYGPQLPMGPKGGNEFKEFIQYARFTDRTENGSIGDSTTATAEKGEELVKRCVDRIVKYYEGMMC